jgi:hypothetical protein
MPDLDPCSGSETAQGRLDLAELALLEMAGKLVEGHKKQHRRASDGRLFRNTPHTLESLMDRTTTHPNGCICWDGALSPEGYGRARYGGREWWVHRLIFTLSVAPLAEGEELDHLCKNPACVNVEHLEIVPHRINLLRGDSVASINAAKTHCINGHPFSAENTYRWAKDGSRRCRTCDTARAKARWQRILADRHLAATRGTTNVHNDNPPVPAPNEPSDEKQLIQEVVSALANDLLSRQQEIAGNGGAAQREEQEEDEKP